MRHPAVVGVENRHRGFRTISASNFSAGMRSAFAGFRPKSYQRTSRVRSGPLQLVSSRMRFDDGFVAPWSASAPTPYSAHVHIWLVIDSHHWRRVLGRAPAPLDGSPARAFRNAGPDHQVRIPSNSTCRSERIWMRIEVAATIVSFPYTGHGRPALRSNSTSVWGRGAHCCGFVSPCLDFRAGSRPPDIPRSPSPRSASSRGGPM